MTKERINEFTLRLTQANKTEIIVIMYDMAIVYTEDAIAAANHDSMRSAAVNGIRVIEELNNVLSYENELGYVLNNYYMYIMKLMTEAIYKDSKDKLKEAAGYLKRVRASFEKVAREDNSEKVMENSESIYAGLTYGRKALYDSLTTEVTRGYTV